MSSSHLAALPAGQVPQVTTPGSSSKSCCTFLPRGIWEAKFGHLFAESQASHPINLWVTSMSYHLFCFFVCFCFEELAPPPTHTPPIPCSSTENHTPSPGFKRGTCPEVLKVTNKQVKPDILPSFSNQESCLQPRLSQDSKRVTDTPGGHRGTAVSQLCAPRPENAGSHRQMDGPHCPYSLPQEISNPEQGLWV